jgi:outer membrane protein W
MDVTRTARATCLARLLACVSGEAVAVQPEDTGRIGLMFGWRYQPNARFNELATMNGYPITGASPGGPTVLAAFGYRALDQLEVAIEVGYAHESFKFTNVDKPFQLNQIPLTIAVRWAPFQWRFYPYIGAGFGYLLNFFSDPPPPASYLESNGSGPVGIIGVTGDIWDRVSLVIEYRYTYSRVQLGDLGAMQVGGNSFFIGVQLAFPPEDRRLKPVQP